MEKTINFRLFAIILISLLASLLILWYISSSHVTSSYQAITIHNTAQTESLREALYSEITNQLADLELGIEISESLAAERLQKLQAELAKILAKEATGRWCLQYALVTTIDGYYPCYNTGGMIYLKAGEVWKYGKTCNGESGRYSGGLPYYNLRFEPQFRGQELDCLLIEKIKIYNYIVHPENISRARRTKTLVLLRPPGNKIDR